ncbi:MAG: hypothetical protein EP306_01705 [Burkholderiales bacterium]|nr:MAG: hypothetical protein EP306_01705 [Burkholderiales bacterium]
MTRLASGLLLVTVLLAAALVAGCGQKGPLFLPDGHGSGVTGPSTAPTPRAQDEPERPVR